MCPLILGGILATSTAAAGPPPSKPFAQSVSFTDLGSSLDFGANIKNLPKHNTFVSLRATAEIELACINPAGNEVPGQKPADRKATLEGSKFVSLHRIIFGRVAIALATEKFGDKIPGAPDCPNSQWTEKVKRVRFRGARVSLSQNGKSVLRLTCRFDKPSSDGPIFGNDFKCLAT